jgi:hypothetical protein
MTHKNKTSKKNALSSIHIVLGVLAACIVIAFIFIALDQVQNFLSEHWVFGTIVFASLAYLYLFVYSKKQSEE